LASGASEGDRCDHDVGLTGLAGADSESEGRSEQVQLSTIDASAELNAIPSDACAVPSNICNTPNGPSRVPVASNSDERRKKVNKLKLIKIINCFVRDESCGDVVQTHTAIK
jgi:hypothetical protein